MGPIFLLLIDIALPVLGVIIVGYAFGKHFRMYDLSILSKMAFYLFAPIMTMQVVRSNPMDWVQLARLGGIFVILKILLALAILLANLIPFLHIKDTKILLLLTLFTNCGYYGFPIVLLAFGEAGLAIAVQYVFFFNLMTATAGIYLASSKPLTLKAAFQQVLRLPLLTAFLVGILLQIFARTFPSINEFRGLVLIFSVVEMLYKASIPFLLLTLGVELSKVPFRLHLLDSLKITFFRLLYAPAVALALFYFFPVLKGLTAQVVILETAMPTAFNAMFLARELSGDYEKAASSVLLTTFLSVLSIPVFLFLLQVLNF
jgi:malate permease and related proteins